MLGEAGPPRSGIALACQGPPRPAGPLPWAAVPWAEWVCSRLSPRGLRKILEGPGTLFNTVKKDTSEKRSPPTEPHRSRPPLLQLRPVRSPEPYTATGPATSLARHRACLGQSASRGCSCLRQGLAHTGAARMLGSAGQPGLPVPPPLVPPPSPPAARLVSRTGSPAGPVHSLPCETPDSVHVVRALPGAPRLPRSIQGQWSARWVLEPSQLLSSSAHSNTTCVALDGSSEFSVSWFSCETKFS